MSKEQEPHEVHNVDNELGPQAVIVEGDKAKLPKFVVPKKERLYLSYDEVTELNNKFYDLVGNLKEGGANAPAELRSVMESVIYESYLEEITQRRAKNRLECEIESERIESLNAILTPRTRRKWIFWKKRNEAKMLFDELVTRQAAAHLQNKADELPSYPGEVDDVELQPFEVVLATLKERLPRMRKKRRASVTELIEQLAYGYNSKVDEFKRLVAEFNEAKKTAADMEERALNAEELLEEFLKESTPAPEEEAEQPEEKQEEAEGPAENTPQEVPTEEEAESETADEEEAEGLSYDGLDEEYESE